MAQPVCLITGAGDSTGAATARRFAQGGYRVALLARAADRLQRLEEAIEGARGYHVGHHDPSAWSFNGGARPYHEKW